MLHAYRAYASSSNAACIQGLGLSRCLGPGECLHSFIHTGPTPPVVMLHACRACRAYASSQPPSTSEPYTLAATPASCPVCACCVPASQPASLSLRAIIHKSCATAIIHPALLPSSTLRYCHHPTCPTASIHPALLPSSTLRYCHRPLCATAIVHPALLPSSTLRYCHRPPCSTAIIHPALQPSSTLRKLIYSMRSAHAPPPSMPCMAITPPIGLL